jgi:hypothetical protein
MPADEDSLGARILASAITFVRNSQLPADGFKGEPSTLPSSEKLRGDTPTSHQSLPRRNVGWNDD